MAKGGRYISPVVAGIIIAVVVLVAGWFLWHAATGRSGNPDIEKTIQSMGGAGMRMKGPTGSTGK